MHQNVTESHPEFPLRRKCELSGLARSSYYRMARPATGGDSSKYRTLQSEIEKICTGMNRYGYRRVTVELQRRSFKITINASYDSCASIICFAEGRGNGSVLRIPRI